MPELPAGLQAQIERFHAAFPNATLLYADKPASYRKQYRVQPILKLWNTLGERYHYLAHRFYLLEFSENGLGGSYLAVTYNKGHAASTCVTFGEEGCTDGTVREEWGQTVRHTLWFEDAEKQRMLDYGRARNWDRSDWGQAFRVSDRGYLKWLERYKNVSI